MTAEARDRKRISKAERLAKGTFTSDEVATMVARNAELVGGFRPMARIWDLDAGYLCHVVAGRKLAGPRLLARLGLEEVVLYRRKKP